MKASVMASSGVGKAGKRRILVRRQNIHSLKDLRMSILARFGSVAGHRGAATASSPWPPGRFHLEKKHRLSNQAAWEVGMTIPIDANALRIGMFVHLNVGWMSHPFPLSSFKITSAEQIATIRALGLARLTWSPERSDP